MRKNIKYILTSILMMLISIIDIKAAFPNQLTNVKHEGGMYIYNFPLDQLTGKMNGENIKVFCSLWYRPDPFGNCTIQSWSSDNTKNEKVSAAIGSIISSFHNNPGDEWDNYFYTTFAINEFLYDKYKANEGFGDWRNYASVPKKVRDIINPYINVAKEIYNNYGKDTIVIDEMTFNGNIINDSVEIADESDKYILNAKMKCYDKETGNQIPCNLPSVKEIRINNEKVIPSISVSIDAKETTISIDLTNYLKDKTNVNISVDFSNRKKYSYAKNYYCGNYVQSVVPDYWEEGYSQEKTLTKSFNVTKKVEKIPTCDEEIIAASTSSNYIDEYITQMENLYNKYKFENIFDWDQPRCENAKFTDTPSCEKTFFSNRWVEKKVIDGKEELGLCKASLSFNNLVYNNKDISKGDLLYKSDDNNGLFGKAILNYECIFHNVYDLSNKPSYNRKIKDVIPKLNIITDFKDGNIIETELNGDLQFLSNGTLGCNKNGNEFNCDIFKIKNVIIDGKTGVFYGVKFIAEVKYRYGNNNKYMISDEDQVVKWQEGNEVYGYGILAPSNVSNINDGNSTLKFSLKDNNQDTVFKLKNVDTNNDSNEVSAQCKYSISPKTDDNIKTEINYRTININSPFNKLDGSVRFTGGNWCDDDKEDINSTYSLATGYASGDVNMDGNIDKDDADLISLFLAEMISFTDLQKNICDIDKDGICYTRDAAIILNMISYPEYIYNPSTSEDANVENDNNGIDESPIIDDNSISDMPGSARRCIGSSDKNKKIEEYITNRPSANSKGTPLYSFKLTAANIKNIREYNKNSLSYSSSNKVKSAFVSKITSNNYADVQKSLCDISEKCNISDVIKTNYNKEVTS